MLNEEQKKEINDFIKDVYVINLPHRTDRLDNIITETGKLGINHIKIIEGIKFSDSHYISGRCGCSAAHCRALTTAYENGLENVLILEDDCFFLDSNLKYIYLAIKDLQKINWDALYLGSRIKSPMMNFSDGLYRISNWGCGHATLYNRKVIKYILDLMPAWNSDYKVWLEWVNQNTCQDVWLPKILGSNADFFVFHTKELCALQIANHSDINDKFSDGIEILQNDFVKYKSI